MKITAVTPVLLSLPYDYVAGQRSSGQSWPTMMMMLVRVETDEGIAGWGESFGFNGCPVSAAALRSLIAPLCLGRDPLERGALRAELAVRLHNYGRNGPVGFALAGLDTALWDIAGKAAGKPVWQLLSDHAPKQVLGYASLLRYGDASAVTEAVVDAYSRGYPEIKLHEIDPAAIEAGRAATGLPLMVDANCRWSEADAVAMAARLQPLDLKWLEEPVWPPENLPGLAACAATGTPIAAGENATTLQEFDNLAAIGKLTYLQPSISKIGLSGMLEVMALAKRRGVKLAPHSPYFGPGLVATIHFIAAKMPGVPVEWFYCDLEANPVAEAIRFKDGWYEVPQAPGLGLEVDEDVVARYGVA